MIKPSLRTRLLRHVMPPLMLTWALGSAVTLGIASFFTQQAYDRSMLDDALLLASNLIIQRGELALDLSKGDLRTVLYDQSESVYFAVLDASGELIAGHPGLVGSNLARQTRPARPLRSGSGGAQDVQFLDGHYLGRQVRAVVLEREKPATARIIVALTTHNRQDLLSQLVLYALLPQALLLAVLTLWLRRVLWSDLAPLARLQGVLERRDAADLSPLPAPLISEAASHDVQALTQSIDGLLSRVAHSVASQREFAGNVAHELKTPLAGVRAAAEYGLAQSDPQRWREQLIAVLKSQQRASHLIDQLLALALVNEAQTSRLLSPLLLNECVRDVLLHALPHVDQSGFELGASGLDDPVTVQADRALIEGLLGNLIDNALRYGRSADGRGSLSVDLELRGPEVWLSVSDQGPGIPPEARDPLMHRWQQGADAGRLGEGAGLGLSIVSRYAELMGARFQLDASASGHGLRASVVFQTSALAQGLAPGDTAVS